MRSVTLALAATVASATFASAFAQQPPAPGAAPPPPPPPPGDAAALAPTPPPPRGPEADRPLPPPPGASIETERGGRAGSRLVVRCAERDSTQECANIATTLLAEVDSKPTK